MSTVASSPVLFYSDKSEQVTYDAVFAGANVTYYSKQPIYNDIFKTNVIGEMGIRKAVYNVDIDVFKNVTLNPDSIGVYTYAVAWNVPGTNGISEFVINVGRNITDGGNSEKSGIYFGALDGVSSNGDFRNYGGSVRKIKDETPLRKYAVLYSTFNPYNTLPLKI